MSMESMSAKNRKVNITVSHNSSDDTPLCEVHTEPGVLQDLVHEVHSDDYKNDGGTQSSNSAELERASRRSQEYDADILEGQQVLSVDEFDFIEQSSKHLVMEELQLPNHEYVEYSRNLDTLNSKKRKYNRPLDYFIKSKRKPSNVKRFCSSWFSNPDFSSWLARSTLPYHAYCKFCRRDLIAGKSELYKHLNTAKHRKRAKSLIEYVASPAIKCEVGATAPPPEDVTSSQEFAVRAVNSVLSQRKIDLYMVDDMHVPLSKEVKNAFISSSIIDENIMDKPHFYGKVLDLESRAAKLLGKEAAMFVLTGSMANTLAVLAHCPASHSLVLVGDKSFLYRHCQTTLTKLNQVSMRALRNTHDGQMDTKGLSMMMDRVAEMSGYGRPNLLCLENPHTYMGGQVLDIHYLQKIVNICSEYDIAIHMDGARLLHAAHASGEPIDSIAAYADSVALCLNKGLDCANGSVIAGDKTFIERCRKLHSVFAVSSMQLECYAAAAIKALIHHIHHISRARIYAKTIVKGLSTLTSSAVTLSLDCTEESVTNSIILECDGVRVTPQHLVQRLKQTPEGEVEDLKERIRVVGQVWSHNSIRLMTHTGLSSEDVGAALKKLKYIIQYEYDNYLVLE